MTEAQQVLQRMLVSTINARDAEYQRVSRLLHDEVGQVLSAVGLQLAVLRLDLESQVPEIGERTQEIQKILEEAVERVRSLSYDLNPAVVDRAGLQLALERLIGRLRSGYIGALRFMYDHTAKVPAVVANAWYKITELAIENAIRHASATRIEVQVKPTAKGLVLEIRDNGVGFVVEQARTQGAGIGLLLLDHYALQAPVSFEIKSSPGKGTVVRSVHTAKE